MGRRIKVLVTGGSGYVAKSLHKALCTKYDITVVGRNVFDLTNYDETKQFFKDKHYDIVVHTAADGGNRLQQDDHSVMLSNLNMHYNLLHCKSSYDRLISFGSGAELEWPASPYGYSKKIIADSLSHRDYCLNLRIFAVFDENELDRRFIKSNLLRYIGREDMVIHQNKMMDFFYMADLVNLVDYHIENSWLYSAIDCRYTESRSLVDIATIINTLSDYKVDIIVGQGEGSPYIGTYRELPIKLIGLEQGIRNAYNILK